MTAGLVAGLAVSSGLSILAVQLGLIIRLMRQARVRRRADEALRQIPDRYRSVVDSQSELICRLLPDATVTFVNEACCRFWEKTPDELVGRRFADLMPPPARAAVADRLARLARGTDCHEHQLTMPDGSTVWHHWTMHAILDEGDRLVEIQAIGRDVTDRKRAQEAFVQLQARHGAMVRAIPDLMFVLRRDGTYVDYHARDPRLLYAPPTAFLGKKVRDVMPPALAEMFMDALERACHSTEPIVVEYELLIDETRYFEARLTQADADRVFSIVRDVTESRRAAALARQLAGRLIASQELERKRIARELHDDVSQRLALLSIEVEELNAHVRKATAPQSPFPARSSLENIAIRAAEVATAVHNLSHDLHPSTLQTVGLVTTLRTLCRDVSARTAVPIAFSHGTLPHPLHPDVSLCLYRIAQEALHNVARHSRAPEAQVLLSPVDHQISLDIADSGVGFDTQAQYGGLGLVSMRERAALLNGQCTIHSVPGAGTRISVQIPLA